MTESLHPHLFALSRKKIQLLVASHRPPTGARDATTSAANSSPHYFQPPHFVFYGPCGVGKYHQSLLFLSYFSPSKLKYQKKILMTVNKQPLIFKMSDVHFEIDLALLGCNPKIVFHDFFMHVVDSIHNYAGKPRPFVFILCKNFHDIHSELLEIFASYMHKQEHVPTFLRFFLLTEHVSFIPRNILHGCELVSLPRPSKLMFAKCFPHSPLATAASFSPRSVRNIADLASSSSSSASSSIAAALSCFKLTHSHNRLYCAVMDAVKQDHSTDLILNAAATAATASNASNASNDSLPPTLSLLKLRDALYDIYIFQTSVNECVATMVAKLLADHLFATNTDIKTKLFIYIYQFFHYYNNNYRPIYHIELLVLRIVTLIGAATLPHPPSLPTHEPSISL